MRSERYQIALIVCGVAITALLGYFIFREMFPEYRMYQKDYVALEKFRSTYTGELPPQFVGGVKQIVFEREDKGPARVDRCISCHVALELSHFSPTQIAHDSQGNIVRTTDGTPVQETNPNYIWKKLDQKIAELKDEKVNQQLTQQGEGYKVAARLEQAKEYEELQTAEIGEHVYDVTKALQMHPLIGKETRPFEFHPVEEYGCTSCHSGNGKGLTTAKAHGPVFDGQYEAEYMGPKQQFLEKDPLNDPQFAHVFNSKPGDDLLFQTSPILVGNLIQSSCVQCHQQNADGLLSPAESEALQNTSNAPDILSMTKNFHRGEQLYISQACYACHRITALSRGGVGPELTRTGEGYPWFIKNKLMWPQGDLKTSTMPNYTLDTVELEDLMTFLLAQKGPNKAVSEIDYKIAAKLWEGGRKMQWEKPIEPSQVHDQRFAMTVFATQGCAACHRLQGFTSNVGFRIEKDKKSSFDEIYKEREWFTALIPEEIRGSALANVLEQHGDEIDQRISEDVRTNSILEEIEKNYPDTVESFYSNFRYASRAKNHDYEQMAAQATDEAKRKEAMNQLAAWNKRIHNVLMIYVQEYGLGRLIGPRPNWSGVYRSDEWLMEHFRNPSGHSPRSIMPIMPFDTSKFYALTYMLDVLGKRNRDVVRMIWEHRGFDPALAYKIYCAQCHGEYLQGNGPVATWIYPIPKNLRNAQFLRNQTREIEIQAIMHGVKGTPMPPWGETPKDKEDYDGIPVLSQEEISQLVDWLFTSIPGGTVIRGSKDVPKWNYTPSDVIDELQREGELLKGDPAIQKQNSNGLQQKSSGGLWPLQRGIIEAQSYYAALEPIALSSASGKDQKQDVSVAKLFDIRPNPVPGGDKELYYIKKEYYTDYNIEQGENFFELNCAMCHGPDADGSGLRASVMVDAKPRMLTNLDWINSRDDLRLLRSIKYGVPGTAMTPWGDFTSSLQRLQLVIFIRSLSEEKGARETIVESIYRSFDIPMKYVEEARIANYKNIDAAKNRIKEIQKTDDGVQDLSKATELFQQQFKTDEELKKLLGQDHVLLDLKSQLENERDLYQAVGNDMLTTHLEDQPEWGLFLKMIATNEGRFTFADGKLLMNEEGKGDQELAVLAKQFMANIEGKIESLKKEQVVVQAKISSPAKDEQLKALDGKIGSFTKLRGKIESLLKQTTSIRTEEKRLYQIYL